MSTLKDSEVTYRTLWLSAEKELRKVYLEINGEIGVLEQTLADEIRDELDRLSGKTHFEEKTRGWR